MSFGEIGNYQGAEGMTELIVEGFEIYMAIYNDTGGALTNGDLVVLDWGADADSLSPTTYYTVGTPATSATVKHQYGVVNNAKLAQTTIADKAWGYVQLRGYCPDVSVAPTDVAAGRFLQGADGVLTAADDGTGQTTDSIGVAVSAVYDTSHVKAILFGFPVLIGA